MLILLQLINMELTTTAKFNKSGIIILYALTVHPAYRIRYG